MATGRAGYVFALDGKRFNLFHISLGRVKLLIRRLVAVGKCDAVDTSRRLSIRTDGVMRLQLNDIEYRPASRQISLGLDRIRSVS